VSVRGSLVTEPFAFDDGRKVTVYVPHPEPPPCVSIVAGGTSPRAGDFVIR